MVEYERPPEEEVRPPIVREWRRENLAPIPGDIRYAMRVFPSGDSLRLAFIINIEHNKFNFISVNEDGSELVFMITPA